MRIRPKLPRNKIHIGPTELIDTYADSSAASASSIANPASESSGQSYKDSTIVNYDSRVVPDLKIPHITTLES